MKERQKNRLFGIFAAAGVLLVLAILYTVFSAGTNNRAANAQVKHNYNNQPISIDAAVQEKLPKNAGDSNQNRCIARFQQVQDISRKLTITNDFDEGIAELDDYFPITDDVIGQMLSEIKVENENIVSPEQMTELRSVLTGNW